MVDLKEDRRRMRHGCGVLIFVSLLLLALAVTLSVIAYNEGVRLVRVTPTITPVAKDMTIWLDDVEWFCLLQDKEWKCEETGRKR